VWDVVGEAGLVRFKGHKDAVTDLVRRLVITAACVTAADLQHLPPWFCGLGAAFIKVVAHVAAAAV
jgi:hypothetical protein